MGRGPGAAEVPADPAPGPGGKPRDGPPSRCDEEDHVPVDEGLRDPRPRGDAPEPDARRPLPGGLRECVPRGPSERGPDSRETDRGAQEETRRVRETAEQAG